MKKKNAAIVIAVFNGADTLQQCLDSIWSQKGCRPEVIVIDGGSSDGTRQILEENSEKISYWCSEADSGISDAWNKGVRKAQSEWVLFIGSDDTLADPNVIFDMLSQHEAVEATDIIYGRVRLLDDDGGVGCLLGERWELTKLKRRMCLPHTGALHRREFIIGRGGYDVNFRIAMDYELLLRRPYPRVLFWPRVVTNMGGCGVSSREKAKSLREAYQAQLKNKTSPKLLLWAWYSYYRCRHYFDLINR